MPQVEVDFAKTRQAFKFLRLYSPHHLVDKRIAEVPAFVSPVQSSESQCRICAVDYTALVYHMGIVTAQHFHSGGETETGIGSGLATGGVYHHHATGWSVEQQVVVKGLSRYQQSWLAYLDCGKGCVPVVDYQFSAKQVLVQRIAGVCASCRLVISEGVAWGEVMMQGSFFTELTAVCYDCLVSKEALAANDYWSHHLRFATAPEAEGGGIVFFWERDEEGKDYGWEHPVRVPEHPQERNWDAFYSKQPQVNFGSESVDERTLRIRRVRRR